MSETHAPPPIVPILPSIPVEHISLLRPTPTFVNELRLVQMATNEPSVIFCSNCLAANRTESAHSELTESLCAAPAEPAIELEVMPPAPVAPLGSCRLHLYAVNRRKPFSIL